MIRTQIYLTETERTVLRTLSTRTGRSQSELIRAAIDEMIDRTHITNRMHLLQTGRGLWKERDDLPDFAALREEFDGNRSAIFIDMYSKWKNLRRANKRKEILAFDAMVAKAIAEAQQDKNQKASSLRELQQYGEQLFDRQEVDFSTEGEAENCAVEAINEIRKERKDAFASSS